MAHWERGYRSHGYWDGVTRLGFVGLPSSAVTAAKDGYGWLCEIPGRKTVSGRTKTLKGAKQAVEVALRELAP